MIQLVCWQLTELAALAAVLHPFDTTTTAGTYGIVYKAAAKKPPHNYVAVKEQRHDDQVRFLTLGLRRCHKGL